MLGLCCEWLALSGENLLISRNLQLGRFERGLYSKQDIQKVYENNLDSLIEFLPIIYNSGIRFFRVSSGLFPLFDKVSPETIESPTILEKLNTIGKFVINNKMRLNTHPGQYVVLSSDSADIRAKAVKELDFHGWVFDKMGLPRTPYYGINVHGGKKGNSDTLRRSMDLLQPSARQRLTLENDEFSYTVRDLSTIGIPIVFDSHHHLLSRDSALPLKDALDLAISTWPYEIKPTTHLSNSKPEHREGSVAKRRIHSDIIYSVPEIQKNYHESGKIDIEVEAKNKNLAIFALVKDHGLSLSS